MFIFCLTCIIELSESPRRVFCAEERTDFMTKKKIFTIAGIAVGAVIVIGIVIWLIFFRGGSVAPSDQMRWCM